MPNNFNYAASTYLDDWIYKDQRFSRLLSVKNEANLSLTEGAACLVEVATHYGVHRTLRDIGEVPRLKAAYELLPKQEQISQVEMFTVVETLARDLGNTYGKIALSASSKFLWMRYRDPIIIYDSIVSTWLSTHCRLKEYGYRAYCEKWLEEYSKHSEEVHKACLEVRGIKRFTLACDCPDEDIAEWTTSEWFMRRVFDYYMLNQRYFESRSAH